MKLFKPRFWNYKYSILTLVLIPFSYLVILFIFLKKKIVKERKFEIPIICIGNIYLGGTGKTPLTLTISEELKNEGIARDLVNRIQNIRKETQLEVTDFINVFFCANNEIKNAINNNLNYICSETLAREIIFQDKIEKPFFADEIEEIQLSIEKTK